MTYVRDQPVASDDLDVSQPKLVTNTNGADDSFGTEHYRFSDLTANNGLHNKVTTPQFFVSTTIPPAYPTVNPTTTTNPIFYAFQPTDGSGTPTTHVGLLQYSRGPNNAVPSPVTLLQSPSTPITVASLASTPVLNLTGISQIFMTVYAIETSAIPAGGVPYAQSLVFWNGSSAIIKNIAGVNISVNLSGSTIQLTNSSALTYSNLYWWVQIYRVS